MIWQIIKNYFIHLQKNWLVAGKSLYYFFMHFAHGLIPIKSTSHEWWENRYQRNRGQITISPIIEFEVLPGLLCNNNNFKCSQLGVGLNASLCWVFGESLDSHISSGINVYTKCKKCKESLAFRRNHEKNNFDVVDFGVYSPVSREG